VVRKNTINHRKMSVAAEAVARLSDPQTGDGISVLPKIKFVGLFLKQSKLFIDFYPWMNLRLLQVSIDNVATSTIHSFH
jgi:hypothetical protein